MSRTKSDEEVSSLSNLFDESLLLVEKVNSSGMETNSSEFQAHVKRGVKQFEDATELVNQLQLFSSNEDIEEVSSTEIKFLLIPALLGFLTSKLTGERSEILKLARVYYRDFLKRLNSYSVIKVRVDESEDEESGESSGARNNNFTADPSLEAMASRRQEKINRYKATKQMEEQLETLKSQMTPSVDDEVVRKYHVTLLRKWAATVLDELDSLELEMKMLGQMTRESLPGEARRQVSTKPRAPMRPFIITKDAIQKKVYGLGYPSVPTMTVDEFVNKKMDEGTWAFSANKAIYENSLQSWAVDPDKKENQDESEDARQDRMADTDDADELRKNRDWDEFKDETKRGAGNRKNMG